MAQATGLRQSTDREGWDWSCGCGASGGDISREVAREQYKAHRRTCGTSSQPEAQSMSEPAKGAAKPPAAKKEGGAKGRKKREQSVKETDVKAALERLKKGGTSLIAESKKLGFSHNGPLRAALRNLIGRPAYDKLMAAATAKPAEKPAAKKPAAKPATKKPAAKKTVSNKPKAAPAATEPAAAAPAAGEVVDVRNVPESDKAGVPV